MRWTHKGLSLSIVFFFLTKQLEMSADVGMGMLAVIRRFSKWPSSRKTSTILIN